MKIRCHAIIFLTVLGILCLPGSASSSSVHTDGYLFRMLDTSSGLPDNNVRNMTMLPDGLMCIQTSTMLNLYNGASCKSYKYNPINIPYTEYSGLNNSYFDRTENLLWCTSRDHIWIFNLNTRSFEYDITDRLSRFGLDSGGISNFFIDSADNYWVVTSDTRLFRCDRSAGVAEAVELPAEMQGPVLMAQSGNRLWLLSINGILAEYDLSLKTVRNSIKVLTDNAAGQEASRMDMVITSEGNVWVMYDHCLAYYDRESGAADYMSGILEGDSDLYTTIAIDRQDDLWVGTARSGVSLVDGDSMEVFTFPYLMQMNGKKIYPHTDISKIYADERGGIWIATLAEGLLFWHKDIYHLHTVNSAALTSGRMPDEGVKCMVEDVDGTVLAGTINGLLRYDPETDSMTVPYPELRNELCISLYRDSRDRIWLGTFYHGAFCIDNGKIRHYTFPETGSAELSYYVETPNLNCVRAFYEDYLGNFWISVYGGVGRFDTEKGTIDMLRDSHPEVTRFMIVRDICDHGDGLLLFSGDNGRFLYSPSEDRVETDMHSVRCYTQSNQAVLDDRGLLWIATSDGLFISDRTSGSVYTVGVSSGLPNDNVISLAVDNMNNIWAATFNSISRIKAIRNDSGYSFSVSNFSEDDGVAAGAFFQNSILKHSGGDIFFGGAHGMTIARPDRLYQETFDISPQISDIVVSGKKLDFSDIGDSGILMGGGSHESSGMTGRRVHLDLSHDESSVSFYFSNLNYINPTHTSYRYILVNFDKAWTEVHSQGLGRAVYTYLQPGDYVFKVYAADNGTDWSRIPAEVSFTIHPPFRKSTVAYILYVMLVAGGVIVGTHLYLHRKRQQILFEKKEELRKQKEELDQMKFRFFTNISHELRTPLTLILLPLESIMKDMKESALYPKLETMHHNARELLSLVNHLLDFRKLEMGGEKLNPVMGNVAEFAADIVSSFQDAAQKKGVNLTFECGIPGPVMAFDKSQMSKIMNNLLSNAMKFTPAGGYVSMELSQVSEDGRDMLRIDVSDTGTGIPQSDLAHIFDRFYQSDNASMSTGSGIGLSLVKQYAEMHGGRVDVSSEVGKGTVFSVRIPMDLKVSDGPESSSARTDVPSRDNAAESSAAGSGMPVVMIVDDNRDFLSYMVSELSGHFNVVPASGGESCLEKLHKVQPDVLVSDVMMPGMDGFELTRRVKNDIETSHIPVILLTARTSDDIRLEGYETGADAYLTKPFKMDILEARIRNLIDERQRRISSFSASAEIRPANVAVNTLDEKLMDGIMESIQKNMDNPDYSVEELSSDVNMHRMNLYRKLQSLVGMTPSEFIRTIRLKKAAQILSERPDISISELADMVGFNTPKYLTRYFKEMFGCTPSQYAGKL